jgi:y4mF family transcriptional regulator
VIEADTDTETDDEADQNESGPQSTTRDALPRAFGALLRRRRAVLGLSQSDLALASGVGRRFIIELEAGKASCQLGKALVVAEALGIRVIDLIREGTIIKSAVAVAAGRGTAAATGSQIYLSADENPGASDDLPDDIEEPSP